MSKLGNRGIPVSLVKPHVGAITPDSEHITVPGHVGTWYVIDSTERDGKTIYLCEHEFYGDNAACVIVDEDGQLLLDNVHNGFDDYDYFIENGLDLEDVDLTFFIQT